MAKSTQAPEKVLQAQVMQFARTCHWTCCSNKVVALGFCDKHYRRFKKHGTAADPAVDVTPAPPEARFLRKVATGSPDECWPWVGSLNNGGYGKFGASRDRLVYAHRWSYEHFIGPIPPGHDVDHTCHNITSCAGGPLCPHRRCVNPAHLEAVTHQVNMIRGKGWAGLNTRKTHCPQGHPLSGENLYVAPGQAGRYCRTCRTERNAARYRER